MNNTGDALRERIVKELVAKPDQKTAELASSLGVERQSVYRVLAYELAGKVQQGSDYRWRLVGGLPQRRRRPLQRTPRLPGYLATTSSASARTWTKV